MTETIGRIKKKVEGQELMDEVSFCVRERRIVEVQILGGTTACDLVGIYAFFFS